jgi:hypothetical protein
MPERSGRLARRQSLSFPVILESLEATGPREVTHTENVSPLGAQVLTNEAWRTREEALVIVAQAGPRRRARVIYCIAREDGRFAIGLALNGPPINWTAIPLMTVG